VGDLRDVGAIPLEYFSRPHPNPKDFVRIDLPAGPGTLRYTEMPRGFTGSIDGTPQAWSYFDFRITGLAVGADKPLSAPTLSLSNVDNYWGILARTYGIRRAPVTIYFAAFDDTGALIDSYPSWVGRLSAHRAGKRLQVSLSPYTAQMAHSSPSESIGKICGYLYKDPDTCQYAGAEPVGQVTCNHTRNNCGARGNLLNWGGEDKMPDPNVTFHWSRVARALPSHPATSGSGMPGPTSGGGKPPGGLVFGPRPTTIVPVDSPTPAVITGGRG